MNVNRSLVFGVSAVGLMLLISFVLMNQSWSKRSREGTLIIAMMSGWAPFMTVNEQGSYEGFDVDVARELAKRMNKELIIIDCGSLAPTFIALDQGKVDLVMSDLDITKERSEKFSMVPYTGEQVKEFNLLFWQQVPANVSAIEDLVKIFGSVVCVEPGSAQERFLDTVSGVAQKSLSKIDDMMLDVQFGKSLAMLVEPQVARRIMRSEPRLKALAVPLPADFQVLGIGIAIAKPNRKLSGEVSSILEAMRSEQVLDQLEQRWQLKGE